MTVPDEIRKDTQSVPRWALWLILGLSLISTASAGVAVVTVVHSNGEHARECDVSARSIHLAIEGIYSIPQRASLPPRTAAENAQRKASLEAALRQIDAAQEKC